MVPTNRTISRTDFFYLDEEKRELNVIVFFPEGEMVVIRGYKPTKNQKTIPLSHVILKMLTLKPTTLKNRMLKL